LDRRCEQSCAGLFTPNRALKGAEAVKNGATDKGSRQKNERNFRSEEKETEKRRVRRHKAYSRKGGGGLPPGRYEENKRLGGKKRKKKE